MRGMLITKKEQTAVENRTANCISENKGTSSSKLVIPCANIPLFWAGKGTV